MKKYQKKQNKKKVLFLSPLPPPYYGSAMSSEMCLNILKDSKDFQVENIKLNYSKEMSDVGKINIDKIKGISEVKKQIKKKLKTFKPDLIYFVPATSGLGLIRDYLFVRRIKKYLGKRKIIFHVRSRTIKNFFNNIMYKKIFSRERAIVLGEQLIKDVSQWIKKENIFILPNAIKNEVTDKEFQEIIKKRKDKQKKESKLDILFLSNMDETKGWFKLLEACKILNEKNNNINFKCNFVGAFPGEKEKEKFNNFVKNNNLQDKVKYFGKKTEKEKNKIIENSDVLVFPTEYKLETFGRVIIEAMMFGLPVLANGIASIPSIIKHNKTGYILKENTPEEISKYIEKLYNNQKQRIDMGKQGRQTFLKEFELNKYGKEFKKILKKT